MAAPRIGRYLYGREKKGEEDLREEEEIGIPGRG